MEEEEETLLKRRTLSVLGCSSVACLSTLIKVSPPLSPPHCIYYASLVQRERERRILLGPTHTRKDIFGLTEKLQNRWAN